LRVSTLSSSVLSRHLTTCCVVLIQAVHTRVAAAVLASVRPASTSLPQAQARP
jgi:hypothetical protein